MRIFFLILSFTLLIATDVATKKFFVSFLWNDYIPLFHDILGLHIAYNSGIAFSIPLSWIALKCITIGIIGYLLYYYWKFDYPKKSPILDIWYIFILSGAFSHAYERIVIWHVIDFIDLKYFAIFNFADIFITVWAFFLFFFYVINYRKYR